MNKELKKKPFLDFWSLWNLSFGFFGVQIAYALQSANISRIFATLGADPHNLSYFWILPPLMDYRATLLAEQAGKADTLLVSMNHIGRKGGYRFYQSSYDSDQQGTVLLVASDPYGIGITYTGYLLLLLGWLWTFCAQGTGHTRPLRR